MGEAVTWKSPRKAPASSACRRPETRKGTIGRSRLAVLPIDFARERIQADDRQVFAKEPLGRLYGLHWKRRETFCGLPCFREHVSSRHFTFGEPKAHGFGPGKRICAPHKHARPRRANPPR